MPRLIAGLLIAVSSLYAHAAHAHDPHACSPDFPEQPVVSGHIEQSDIDRGLFTFDDLFEIGRDLFAARFNICDGQGRPATTGTGEAREPDEPAFIRTSAPDANSCAGCHNMPRDGGAGEFVVNVFVLAQSHDPVITSVGPDLSNDRNTLGMFGSGAIEMLAREMTEDLLAQADGLEDGDHVLVTKGVEFEITVDDGAVVQSRGIDTDLIVKPFHQSGVVRSLREFTVNAYNHHHGMQAEERFDLNPAKNDDPDFDRDGVDRELTVGDITAVTVYQAGLGVPGRVMPADPRARREVNRGERLFSEIGCTGCHKPALVLDSPFFVEPYERNPDGTFSDTEQSFRFDMTADGEGPLLERSPEGDIMVRAYTDLKRHNLCDADIKFLCNERLAQGRPNEKAGSFITRKLWDVGNSAPYGHRGDLTTITDAVLVHGGEGRAARDAFAALATEDQAAIIAFLKTLQVLPPGSPPVITEP